MKSPISQKPNRKSLRLRHFDYSQNSYYFITICTKNKQNFFGKIDKDKIILNELARIVQERWYWLQENFEYVEIDEFVVMPNHVHGIIIINNEKCVNRDLCTGGSRPAPTSRDRLKIKSLSELVGAFKTTSSKQIHQSGFPEFSWHRSFYDHIIRDEEKLKTIRKYIINNPIKLAIYKGLM